jgi:hypothetical protein
VYPAKKNTACDDCGNPLDQKSGRGRPRRYCNKRCATGYRDAAKWHTADMPSVPAYPLGRN